ncbi:sensor histidine kinase [Massilia sp. CF038]|uniref:sensor histidine kinase n=1 Tax=Massilia sp. CF038 TaxID=1881045 RepID=UPI00091F690C|nr:histidine kinase [Massilia sp. CF038]SHH02231.1 Histidine kinase [Massilia sp. CF038]
MQGLFSSRRGAALYLMVWLLLGLVFAGSLISATGAGWLNGLLFALPVTLVYGCAAGFSSYYLCRAYPLDDKRIGAILVVFGFSAMISALLWTGFCILWNSLWLELGVPLSAALKATVFGLGVVLYGLSAIAHYLTIEFQRARNAERRELESKLMAQEAELRMLRTQIDPHFLFNSLNSISALTSQNPKGAREMTLQLAEFFRHTLGLEAHRKVPLEAEIRLVTHFLAIETVRFGARLQVQQMVADDARDCLLPPMLLQPLVENAVKHGIGNLAQGGTIRITAQRAGSILHVVVENDVDTDLDQRPGRGIGLANVRQRLATLYGHQASVNWTREQHTFRVAVALPAETTE